MDDHPIVDANDDEPSTDELEVARVVSFLLPGVPDAPIDLDDDEPFDHQIDSAYAGHDDLRLDAQSRIAQRNPHQGLDAGFAAPVEIVGRDPQSTRRFGYELMGLRAVDHTALKRAVENSDHHRPRLAAQQLTQGRLHRQAQVSRRRVDPSPVQHEPWMIRITRRSVRGTQPRGVGGHLDMQAGARRYEATPLGQSGHAGQATADRSRPPERFGHPRGDIRIASEADHRTLGKCVTKSTTTDAGEQLLTGVETRRVERDHRRTMPPGAFARAWSCTFRGQPHDCGAKEERRVAAQELWRRLPARAGSSQESPSDFLRTHTR